MKCTQIIKHSFSVFFTLALASSASMAQTNILIEPSFTDTGGSNQGNQINVAFGSSVWQNWYVNFGGTSGNGITNYSLSFDTNNPPPNGDTLGSVRSSWSYDGTNAGGGSTFACIDDNFWGGATFDASHYSNYAFDFKYDTNSTILPTNAAQFSLTIDTHMIDGNSQGAFLENLANSGSTATLFDGAWHHISVPLPSQSCFAPSPVLLNANLSKGPGYNWYNGAGTSGTFTFWMANLGLDFNEGPICPPIISFTPAVQGLNLWNDKAPNYTRHQVRTDTLGDFNVNWVGHTPVTYTWNYAHAPTNNGAGVNFAITPDPASSAIYPDPDWSSTNCFYLAINEVGGTSVVATVTVKTNQPSNNSNASAIARLTNNTPTAAGTWSLTFTNDTDFVLTAPGGTNMAATIPANFLTDTNGQLNIYSNQVSIFLSATPNNDQNYGSYADITTFDVTGVATPIHENFVTQGGISSPFLVLQDQTYGSVPTNTAPNMLFITSNDWAWLTWTLPDAQFNPVVRTNLTSGSWLDSPLTNINLFGTTRYTLISKAYQQASTQQYFALVKRAYSQLQVLLPGETNAPGTPTGKTGTPNPVSIGNDGGLITYTINACSSDWHIIPGVFDNITNTCTDGTAQLPPNAALLNGTQTFQLVFGQTGSFTITASDITSLNPIAPGTSSPVTVVP